MNTTIEKVNINTANITENKIEKTKEIEKKPSLNDQFCLKALDYFIF